MFSKTVLWHQHLVNCNTFEPSRRRQGAEKGKRAWVQLLVGFQICIECLQICIYTLRRDASSLWQQEWHDSFCRNGFADFVPPMNSNVKCLLLDNNAITRIGTTGSDVGDGLDDGSNYDSSSPDITDDVETATSNKTRLPWDPFSPSSSTPSRSNGEREYTDYADSKDNLSELH